MIRESWAFIGFLLGMVLCLSLTMCDSAFPFTEQQVLDKAQAYLPMVFETFTEQWANAPLKHYEGGKIEQETCASLSKCWNPKAEFETSREYGFGFGMITITERFNNFEEAKKYEALKDWKWDDRYNPKYQTTYSILEDRKNFTKYRPYSYDDKEAWACALVVYNAGAGTVNQRRALCKLTEDCDSTLWFGGLNSVHRSYENEILYGRPKWKLRNTYPHNVINIRADKYSSFFKKESNKATNEMAYWQKIVEFFRNLIRRV